MGSRVLEHAERTDTGQRRSRNEDAVRSEPGSGLFVVADGMGGHAAGHVASSLAVGEVADRMAEADEDEGWETARRRLAEAVAAAGERILREASENPEKEGMGTTCTALLLRGDRWTVANIGDSRAYRLRDGELEQVSVDHTAFPGGSALTRALGTGGDPTPDLFDGEARPGDVFLLCSDGLMLTHPDDEIAGAMAEVAGADDGGAPDPVVDRLVEESNERGAPDNVTVLVVAVR